MLLLEEYITQRKTEDGINDRDLTARYTNAKACMGYVLDYYTTYLDSVPEDSETALQLEKYEKYRKQLKDYNPDIQDWLVQMYRDHGNMLNRLVRTPIHEDVYFYLHYKPEEFETATFDVYAKLIKLYPYLHGQNAKLKQLITEYHHINSDPKGEYRVIDDSVDEWVYETYDKYGVNLDIFASKWTEYFSEHPELWPKGTKKRSRFADETWIKRDYDYDYTKSDKNLFGIDILYRDMPKHSFLHGKKQELLTLLVYHGVWPEYNDKEAKDYWEKYKSCIRKHSGL